MHNRPARHGAPGPGVAIVQPAEAMLVSWGSVPRCIAQGAAFRRSTGPWSRS